MQTMLRNGAVFVLVTVTWALATVMRRVDSALQQMGVGDSTPGSALGFPVSWSDMVESLRAPVAQESVIATRTAWQEFASDVAGRTVLRSPFAVAQSVVWLDVCFLLLYTALAVVALVALSRFNAGTGGSALAEQSRLRRSRLLLGSVGALAMLVVVDIIENIELERALVLGQPLARLPFNIALGPLMSLLKVPLAAGVLVPLLFVAFVLAARSRPLRRTLVSVRGVLYVVAGLYLILMFGMGAAQVDDVVRAWDGWRAAWAVVACLALAVTVAGVTRYLGVSAREQPAPDVGRNAQSLLLGTAVVLILAGQVLRVAGFGWGLSVAGALFAVMWALGLPIDGLPEWPATPKPPRGWVLLATGAAGGVAGAVLAALAGWSLLLGAAAGAVAALTVLAGRSLRAPRRDEAEGEVAGVDALARARAEADRAMAARDRAMAAAAAGNEPEWSAQCRAAADHAAAAKRLGDDAQAAGAPTTAAAAIVAAARQAARAADEAWDVLTMAEWSDRIARFAGAAVAAIVVVAIARATALDAYIRETPNWAVIGWPVAGAVAAGVVGLVICIHQRRWTRTWWVSTFVALVAGGWLLHDANATGGAQAAGSVSLLLGGFTLITGTFALFAALVRRGPLRQYALAPVLRSLKFTRFPVVPFLVVWVVIVSALDSGGFHDIRRFGRQTAAAPPTIGQAWQQYLRSAPSGQARPVVFVAAQGGGIRAAVWTALVMECVFGPGPVAKSGTTCAEGDGESDPARLAERAAAPLPVFLASGASGGSVGLAAWTARRADLVEDGAASSTPRSVEDALDRDFVAPTVARLLLADIPHAFFAWNRADRAEMLERAWERPWQERSPAGAPARGLSRGLRETWDVTHRDSDDWATPVLALNGVSVEDDCRFVASAVDFTLPRQIPALPGDVEATDDEPDDAACRGVDGGSGEAVAVDILPSTSELIDYLCASEDVPLSTAAHLSARFPYVSPTGRVERRECADEAGLVPDPAISYDADGGIFDNSGAGTAVDTWRALAPFAAAAERQDGGCIVPIFLQIDNSPPSATVSSSADPRPDEITAPIGAILGQISSRDRYARAGAAAAFGPLASASGQRVETPTIDTPKSLWFQIALFGQPGPEPPLGWTLAPETVEDMRSQLRVVDNDKRIQALRALLRPGGLSCASA